MKKLKLLSLGLCLLAGVFAAATPARATMTRNPFVSAANGGPCDLGFIEYLPPDFNTAPAGTKFPVIIFLHGSYGGMSNASGFGTLTDLVDVVEPHSLPKRLKDGGLDLEAIVIAPASPWFWEQGLRMQQVHNVLNWVNNVDTNPAHNTKGKCDLNRLYVTGLSMGGTGTINWLHDYFSETAAAAPVCAVDPMDTTVAANVVTVNKPVWSFHALNDNPSGTAGTTHARIARAYNSGISSSYNAIQDYTVTTTSGPPTTGYISNSTGLYSWNATPDWDLNYNYPMSQTSKKQLFTLFPDQGHSIWNPVYYKDNLYNWMLSQSLSNPVVPPTAFGPLNGSFEAPTTPTFAYGPTGGNWSFSGNSGIVHNDSIFGNAPAPDGAQAAFVQSFAGQGTNGVITQTVTLPDGNYNITLKAARRNGQTEAVRITVNGADVSYFTPGSNSYDYVTTSNFTGGTKTIAITATTPANPNVDVTAFIDDFRINYLSGTGTGLTGQYYSDQNLSTLVTSRVDPTVDFNWGGNYPMSSIGSDHFSIRWSGQVQAVETGQYTFTTTTDDGVRLWVNGVSLFNDTYWNVQAALSHSATISLVAGQKYNIKMEYFENDQGALAQLSWTRPGGNSVIIPQSQLFPTFVAAPTIANAGFETPTTTNYVYNPSGGSWTFAGTSGNGSGIQKPGAGQGFGALAAPAGTQTGFLQNLGSITQSLNFATTGNYTLTYKAAQRPNINSTNQTLKISLDGTQIDSWVPTNNSAYNTRSFNFTVPTIGTKSLKLEGTVASGDSTALIDGLILSN